MLRELKTFIAVTRYGTFAAAGMHIGLTQSAVSAQIRNLEQALGIRLFDRTGRQAILNAAGQRALPMAREMLETFSRMAVSDGVGEYRGELKIGAVATVQTGLLPRGAVAAQATGAVAGGETGARGVPEPVEPGGHRRSGPGDSDQAAV